jgi:hypothetical protein
MYRTASNVDYETFSLHNSSHSALTVPALRARIQAWSPSSLPLSPLHLLCQFPMLVKTSISLHNVVMANTIPYNTTSDRYFRDDVIPYHR